MRICSDDQDLDTVDLSGRASRVLGAQDLQGPARPCPCWTDPLNPWELPQDEDTLSAGTGIARLNLACLNILEDPRLIKGTAENLAVLIVGIQAAPQEGT